MTDYPIPVNERQRLDALDAYAILDTEPEEPFDRITALAARLFHAPIALVSLVAEDRQWFKARHGLDVAQTSRELSFCTRAMLGQEVMVIGDASADPTFNCNALVTGEPSIRFYAGAPLRTRAGLPLGSLCVIDTAPRDRPDDSLLESLADLAALVVEQLEVRISVLARQRAEDALRQSLREKETLLQEVHHRVKNNLQVISSMLELQGECADSEVLRTRLVQTQLRILSMALIHEQLCSATSQRDQPDDIDFGPYIHKLVRELLNAFEPRPGRIVPRIDADSVLLSIDQAIPCSLILNELLTNAVKHAYPESEAGEVAVELKDESGRVRLTVSDRGVGLGAGLDRRNGKTLGMRIVDALVRQLGGSLTVQPGQGASFRLDFSRGASRGSGKTASA